MSTYGGDKHMTKVKVTVNLPEQVVEDLRAMAEERGTTLTETLKDAVQLEKYIHEETKNKSKVLVQKADKSIHELVIR
jgi:hypothetical protein